MRDCEHGRLARKCTECMDDTEIKQLKAQLKEAEKVIDSIAKQESPYCIHEHRDDIEERFHKEITKARKYKTKYGKEWGMQDKIKRLLKYHLPENIPTSRLTMSLSELFIDEIKPIEAQLKELQEENNAAVELIIELGSLFPEVFEFMKALNLKTAKK